MDYGLHERSYSCMSMPDIELGVDGQNQILEFIEAQKTRYASLKSVIFETACGFSCATVPSSYYWDQSLDYRCIEPVHGCVYQDQMV